MNREWGDSDSNRYPQYSACHPPHYTKYLFSYKQNFESSRILEIMIQCPYSFISSQHRKKPCVLFALFRISREAPVSYKFVQFISRKKEEKILNFSLDMSIKRIALAGTLSSEEYNLCQITQNLSVAHFIHH